MKAFLVVGPEASGNRYMTRVLCACGCAGRGDHAQPFDVGTTGDIHIEPPYPKNVALLRSYPYGHDIEYWLDLPYLVGKLRSWGYEVTVLVMVRDPSVIEQSQIATGHVTTEAEAWANIQRAYRVILRGVLEAEVNFQLIPYSNLNRPTYVKWLLDRLGLTPGAIEPFVDADAKHVERLSSHYALAG